MGDLRQEFKHGEDVVLDKEYHNTSIVTVVRQSEGKLFTTVKSGKAQWDVMTGRLDKIEEN